MRNYRTIVKNYENEIEEKKSRFIGQLFPIEDEEEAKAIIASTKKKYRDARHHCSAYIFQSAQVIERYSDDGEPAGTAGMPILEVLRGKELTNVLCIVTRYFGGTKLGTGGLVRAYTSATQTVLEDAEIVEKDNYIYYEVTVSYTISGKLEYYIQKEEYLLEDTIYGEDVSYKLYSRAAVYEQCCSEIVELCNDQCEVKKLREQIGYVAEGRFITGPDN